MDLAPAIELSWSRAAGADSCIDASELAGRVSATLGRPVSVHGVDAGALPSAGTTEILEGAVEPLAAGGWVAVVDVRSSGAAGLHREVTLDATDCRQLDEAIVLVVALMADATLSTAPRLVVPRHAPSASIAIGPDVAFAIGMLPGLATGVGISADVAIPRYWHVAAWAHAWPIAEAVYEGAGARLAAWTFGLGPCVSSPVRGRSFSLEVFGCIGAEAGVVYASGIDLDVSRSRALAYLQAEVRTGARWRVFGPLSLRLDLGAALPVTRDVYQFVGADGTVRDVFRTAPVVPLGGVAVEFRTP